MIMRPFFNTAIFVAVLCGMIGGASPDLLFAQVRSVWSATPVGQPNGSVTQMPLKWPVSRFSKLSLQVDTRWAQNYGYRPVEVTVTSPTPATADHLITIRLHSGWGETLNVEQDLLLPLGSTSATMTVAVPQYQMTTQIFWWDVWVDGTKDRDLSIDDNTANSTVGGGFGSLSRRSFLVMGSKSGQRSLVSPNSMEFEVLSLTAAEFPRRWIDYTCLDVIALSLNELQQLTQANPEAFRAVRRWLRAGGQVWVNDVGQQLEQLSEVSKLFQLPDSIDPETKAGGKMKAESGAANDDSFHAGWRPVRFVDGNPDGQVVTFLDHTTGKTRTVRDPDVIARLQYDPNFTMTGQQYETAEDRPAVGETDSSRWFVEQRIGLGRVRAFRATNDVSRFERSQPTANLNAAANGDGSEEMPPSLAAAVRSVGTWDARHGLAPDDANFDFARLLVPGVGMAPVTEFRVLITLFVLLIGPVNYWLLKRWRRLHLMVLTVPVAAALVTLALFGYAIVSDGFGTTVRAHSFTALDQRTGESACWTRLSYYSGLAPGRGLTMPADVAMYPIIPGWSMSSIDAHVGAVRDVVWKKDEAKLTRGWLRSRTPTQYLTIRSRKSPLRVELTPVRDKLRAKNELGTTIKYLVVIDDANKLWSGEQLSPGAVAFLQPAERSEAVERFRKLVKENAPELPEALTGDDSTYARMQRQQWRMYRGRYGSYSSEQTMETNLANDALTGLAGLAGRDGLALPPRSYVAVTATGPEVEFGMDGAKEAASFHVVVGQW